MPEPVQALRNLPIAPGRLLSRSCGACRILAQKRPVNRRLTKKFSISAFCELSFKTPDFARHAVGVPSPAQISQLIGFASDLNIWPMGDKSPKSKNKQAAQKQAKAVVESQKKKTAVSAKQVEKPRK